MAGKLKCTNCRFAKKACVVVEGSSVCIRCTRNSQDCSGLLMCIQDRDVRIGRLAVSEQEEAVLMVVRELMLNGVKGDEIVLALATAFPVQHGWDGIE